MDISFQWCVFPVDHSKSKASSLSIQVSKVGWFSKWLSQVLTLLTLKSYRSAEERELQTTMVGKRCDNDVIVMSLWLLATQIKKNKASRLYG